MDGGIPRQKREILTWPRRVGSPRELYETKGQFYEMMRHSGEFEDLEELLGKTD